MSRARVQAVGGSASFVLAAVAGVIGNQLSGTAPWAWVAFLVVLVIGVCVTVWAARLTTPPNQPEAATLARALAERVRAWITREQEASRIADPRPLPVHWHTAAKELFDKWPTIHGAIEHGHGDAGGGQVPLAGGFTDIRRTYQAVPSRRLVILGRAGAGKTVLAYQLIASLLDDTHHDYHHDAHCDGHRAGRVPVLFSLGGWDPGSLVLRDWMIQQLLRDHPFLDARDHTWANGATALVEGGWVLPVLDGFDEIPQRYHRDAIDEISRFDGPLVLTSRPDKYTTAVRDAKVPGRAAAIEIDDLSLDDVQRYLQDSIPQTRTAAEWGEVFDHLRSSPEDAASGNLIPVLTTALMVMLARTTYNNTPERTPRELLDTDRFPNTTALEQRLLDNYLDTVYDRRRAPGPNAEAAPRWKPERARHWLGYLATHLRRRDTQDLTWWQLPSTLGRHTRILTTMTTFGFAGALAGGLAYGLAYVLAGGLPYGLAAGLAGGLAGWLAFGLAVGLPYGLAFGVAFGLLNEAGFFRGHTGREPERLRLRWRRRTRAQRSLRTYLKNAASQATSVLTFGLTYGLANALANVLVVVLANELALELTNELAGGHANVLGYVLAGGLAGGLMFGLVFGLANVVVSALGDNQDPQDAISPWQLLTTDRTATHVRTLVVGLAFGLTFGLAGGLAVGLTTGLTSGLLAGLLGGLARLVISTWGQWLLFTRLWLPLTGRLPWRPKRFLEDAHRRGVLRQAGAVYQFRHAQLRDHLANHYPTTPEPTPTTASAI